MKRRRIILTVCSLLSLIGVYVGAFSYAWLRSPSRFLTLEGQRIHVVEFHFNLLLWNRTPIWDPAFWFVERVSGYQFGPYAPMGENSIVEYVKVL